MSKRNHQEMLSDALRVRMGERKAVHKREKSRRRKRFYKQLPRDRDMDYYEARRKELHYYLFRSDLTSRQIASSLGLTQWWLEAAKHRRIKKPNDRWVQAVIDLIKDYERLQTYYRAIVSHEKPSI